MDEFESKSLGYQISHGMFSSRKSLNNAGDPFSKNIFHKVNSHADERELVLFFGKHVLGLKAEEVWGYCASGSTEGIMNGLWMARKRFPLGACIYASADCHYCVPKIADMLCMPYKSVSVDEDTGSMNMDELRESIEAGGRADEHAIVLLTMGTTIRNGYDDIARFYEVVADKLPNTRFHVHVDGAFGGVIYPFVKPEWLDYRVDTFNMSFHKFLGCPYPCTIFITPRSVQNEIKGNGCFGKEMVCLPDKDFTISCSRNGTAVALMKEVVCSDGFEARVREMITRCFENKAYFVQQLKERTSVRHASVEPLGMSVELKGLPSRYKELLAPYGVSVRWVPNTNTFDTHVYVCEHVDKALLDEVVELLAGVQA